MIATTDYDLVTQRAGSIERQRIVLELAGGEAAEFLQGQVTNDVEALAPGEGCYAALLDHKGKLRSDLRVLRTAPDRLLVDADPAGLAPLWHTFETYSLGRDVKSADLSSDHVVVSLLGPEARTLLDRDPGEREHSHVEGEHGRYVTTDLGVDVIAGADAADAIRALAPAIDDELAECVRIETGRPRLGLDMDGSTIPQEAGLNERAVSFTKGCYVGQETVARLFYRGKPNRHLRGLRLAETVEHGSPIMLGERQVGSVGSVAVSPTHGPIGLALVRREAAPGDEVTIADATATVVELPFEAA